MADAGDVEETEKGGAAAAPQVNEKAKAHWKAGNSFFETSKMQEAIAEYNEAVNIDPKYADAYFNRALTYRILQEYDLAQRDLEKVMELQPKSWDAPLLIGDMSESKNDLLGAKFWYEKSLANNPNYAEAKTRLQNIDAIMHADMKMPAGFPSGSGIKSSTAYKPAQAEQKTVIEDGQIKRLAFYKSDSNFGKVAGLEKIKQYLTENVVLAIKTPALFKKYGKQLGLGLILYGPPGVGKTYIVNALAGEADAKVFVAQINQIIDMYTGNTEKNLHAIFEAARDNTPCILVFDELDALGVKRGGGGGEQSTAMRSAINQFLVEMNGLEKNPEGIFVVGTTNQPWDIDPALKRSGRFGDRIYVGPPTYKERVAMLKLETKNKPKGFINYGRLARATTGYSPADIKKVVDKAAMRPLLHEYTTRAERKLTTGDIIAVLKNKDENGSSLDEWYSMVKKDVISKTETQIVDGKKQEIVKEGKLDAQEKVLYKKMIKDIKKNTNSSRIFMKKMARWWATHVF
ncbi:AAA family ATPase [Candidatus Marsarchaeota archaeon]|jgi:AAA+ superfamily predicted ATPase|nr:AAA family ATPase [Candidatus Marsarchaeota archaeon]